MGMGVINLLCVWGWGGGGMLACLCERISSFYSIPFTLCLMRQLYMLPFIACRFFIMYSVFQYVYNFLNLLSRHKPALYPFFLRVRYALLHNFLSLICNMLQ